MKHFSLKLRKILLCDFLYYVIFILSIIYIIIFVKKYIPPCNYNIDDTNFILTITSIKVDDDKLSLEFKENLIGTYYFSDLEEKNVFLNMYKLGDKLNVVGTLKEPNKNTIPNIFNYKKYLYYKGIKYILSIEEYNLYEKNKDIFLNIKNYFYDRVNNIENNSYIYAFILGKSNYIDNESYNNYKINGVTHLFALSGLHVSIFSGILLSIFNKLKLNEKISFILTSLFLIFFSFIASFTPSILRATIFFILSSINKIYYLFIKPKYLLYLTFVILVLINPLYIFNTGFILSFTITFFILLFNENYRIKNSVMSTLIISLLSFFSSLPIIINMSYEINIIGFVNNVIFIPLVSNIVFPLAILTLIFNKLSFILNILTNIMEIISSISSNILNITIFFQKLTILEIVIYYIIFILIVKKKNKLIIPFILFVVYLYIKPYFDKNTYIYFIDVGQGDSTLIITENNKTILVDTGGIVTYSYKEDWATKNKEFNLVTSSAIPFFKSVGVKKIDYLFLTHGDFDHLGYSYDLVNNFRVKNVVFNHGEYNGLEKKLINLLEEKNIKYYQNLEELNIDNNKLYFLNNKLYDNENDNSNVIYIIFEELKLLLMGDAGIEVEEDIMKKYELNNIDILKVGHHGSSTSSCKSFIDKINPSYSVISAGRDNKYGHPHEQVLVNLNKTRIYRTDQDGSVMFKIKNNKLKIETCAP